MENIKDIDKEIKCNNEIEVKKQISIFGIVLIIIGVIAMFYSEKLENLNLDSALMLAGATFAICGIVKLFIFKRKYTLKSTKEVLHRKELYFTNSERAEIEDFIKNKNVDGIIKLSKESSSDIMIVIYYTPSNKYAFLQLNDYITYQYIPMQDPFVIC
ncbi:MAG: hypothetical protein IMY73_05345 [Bacteroidetes bacterium]|nr:hypothetical protein [Bacteroidota bacterium]